MTAVTIMMMLMGMMMMLIMGMMVMVGMMLVRKGK